MGSLSKVNKRNPTILRFPNFNKLPVPVIGVIVPVFINLLVFTGFFVHLSYVLLYAIRQFFILALQNELHCSKKSPDFQGWMAIHDFYWNISFLLRNSTVHRSITHICHDHGRCHVEHQKSPAPNQCPTAKAAAYTDWKQGFREDVWFCYFISSRCRISSWLGMTLNAPFLVVIIDAAALAKRSISVRFSSFSP